MTKNPSARNSQEMEELLKKSPVIPVLTINSIHEAVPLARALVRGGLSILEVTLRTDCAYDAIEKIREEVPEAVVGGGTVTTVEHLEKLTAVGAHFAVSPGITPELLRKARDLGMPYLPGITSVSELMTGLNEGYEVFKFFPAAASGGVKALKSFSGPFSQVRFCPTGGINRENYQNYLSLPNTLCVGGSWVAPKDAIANENWEVIENLSRDAVMAVAK